MGTLRRLSGTLGAAALALSGVLADASAAEGDPAAGKRQTITCNGCHGQSSMKTVPLLGGQDAAYFVAAMRAYQEGTRAHATMRDVAKAFGDRELRNLAAWYAQSTGPESEDTAAEAPPKAVACTACHGTDGSQPATAGAPKLAGQRLAVLAAALRDYRDGKRDHEIMQAQARTLEDADIDALSAYFAARRGLHLR